jgi:uncharacterized protein YxeA
VKPVCIVNMKIQVALLFLVVCAVMFVKSTEYDNDDNMLESNDMFEKAYNKLNEEDSDADKPSEQQVIIKFSLTFDIRIFVHSKMYSAINN